MGLGQKESC